MDVGWFQEQNRQNDMERLEELEAENAKLEAQVEELICLAKAVRKQHDDRTAIGSWGPATVLTGTDECGCQLCMMARKALAAVRGEGEG
jgi:hypothetical protein